MYKKLFELFLIGYIIIFSCDNIFSVIKLVNASAVAEASSSSIRIPSHPSSLCHGRPNGMLMRDFVSCDGWYRCKDGIAIEHGYCQPPFLFDEDKQICNWATNVNCFQCSNLQPFAEYEVQNSCRQFIRCISGVAQHLECQPGLLFDPTILTCNNGTLVNCNVPPETNNYCPDEDDPNKRIFFRDQYNCGVFFVCINGKAHRQDCAPELHFNPEVNQCDLPHKTNCNTLNVPDGPPQQAFNCANQLPGSGPIYPHPADCHSYIVCDTFHTMHLFPCAPTLVFDWSRLICDAPDRAICIKDA